MKFNNKYLCKDNSLVITNSKITLPLKIKKLTN